MGERELGVECWSFPSGSFHIPFPPLADEKPEVGEADLPRGRRPQEIPPPTGGLAPEFISRFHVPPGTQDVHTSPGTEGGVAGVGRQREPRAEVSSGSLGGRGRSLLSSHHSSKMEI